MNFTLQSKFKPIPEQSKAVEELVKNIQNGEKSQVLLGVTGSGKTFTLANVIEKVNRPTLVISHNKTLAAQFQGRVRNSEVRYASMEFVSLEFGNSHGIHHLR